VPVDNDVGNGHEDERIASGPRLTIRVVAGGAGVGWDGGATYEPYWSW